MCLSSRHAAPRSTFSVFIVSLKLRVNTVDSTMCGGAFIRERVFSSQRGNKVLIGIGEMKCSFWTASLVSPKAQISFMCRTAMKEKSDLRLTNMEIIGTAGAAYTVGPMNRDHWLLYLTTPNSQPILPSDPKPCTLSLPAPSLLLLFPHSPPLLPSRTKTLPSKFS